ncbi:rRNA biogenesis protein rrp5 [Malassezia yamatoensis]|uniref:rRNA biogenesis protein rrp5 n=1 Tax=Malassezia yamatoensis TaxID=253288 RepID=A0AAJ5YR31_9BASI|nr:rRNA biogenesis protein rrp5 [Malassezia yamatoensis]
MVSAEALSAKRKAGDTDGEKSGKHEEGLQKRVRRDSAPIAPHLSSRPQPESFPRGGGNGLTPTEFRQTLLEGRSESGAQDDLFTDGKSGRAGKSAKAKHRNMSKKSEETNTHLDKVRVEMLNYKRLVPGTKMLCNVLAVHPLALVVSMCDQLLGHIPVTSISSKLTQRLQDALDEDEMAGNPDLPDHDATPPELRDIYTVGQWVVATVETVLPPNSRRQWGMGREGGEYERESQRVQLSMDPSEVNDGLRVGDLSEGFLLPATITSHEDHGYGLNLGLDAKGFLPSEKAKDPLRLGQVLMVAVDAVASNGRLIRCKLLQSDPQQLRVPPSQEGLLPGECIKALITSCTPHGLVVKLFGLFDGTVDNMHVPASGLLDPESMKIGKKIMLRVLWNMPSDIQESLGGEDTVGARRIGLSGAPQILTLTPPLINNRTLPEAFPIGTRVQAKVARVVSEWGLLCNVDGDELQGFAHISRVADEHIDALSPNNGPYKIGTTHEARVVGHAMTDRLLQLSLQPSVLAKEYMRVSDVPLGAKVRASVHRVTPTAIFLRLNGNVDGVVFPLHFSDVHLKHPEKKYKPGLELNAKIIHTDPERNRIVLTLKRSLIDSDLPFIASVEDAKVGSVTHAVVIRHLQKSLLVELGGTVRAIVPMAETSDTALTQRQVEELYTPGKVIKVRLTRIEPETGRIVASIKQASAAYLEKLNIDAVEIGQRVSARVAALRDDVVILVIEPAGTRALLVLPSLARLRKTSVAKVRDEVLPGDLIENLYVINKVAEKGLVILGDHAPSSKTKIAVGSELTGEVLDVNEQQLYATVQLADCRARLHRTEVADDFEQAELPSVGSSVSGTVIDVRRGGREADFSTRRARNDSSAEPVDRTIDSAKDLQVGTELRGFVKAVTNNGVFVSLGRCTDARVMIKELFDEYVKDFKSRFHLGQLVRGVVLAVDGDKVEFSLKASRLQSSTPSNTKKSSSRLRDYSVGDKIDGYVRGTADYGVFVQINGTDISGLAHKSELADNPNADAVRAFDVGDRVKAKVLKVDADKGRISFGLKPSYFDEADYNESEEENTLSSDEEQSDLGSDEDETSDEDESADSGSQNLEDLSTDRLIDDEAEDTESNDSDQEESDDEDEMDEDVLQFIDDGSNDDESNEDLSSGDDSDAEGQEVGTDKSFYDDESEVESESDRTESHDPRQSLQDGIRWDSSLPDDHGSDDSSDDDERTVTKRRRGVKINEDITAELNSKKLESSTDFERLLLGSPNSSYLWIQFMGFHLQLGDVDKARQVARRALQAIHYREEQEKLNVWIALMNLENMYGSPETLAAVFREATQVNNPLEVHLRLVAIYEQSGKTEETAELFRRTAKKFGFSTDVWVQWYQFYLRHNRPDDAHALVSRSLQSLERSNHISVLTAYALSEYKLGDVEHARTLFETLVERYPKRLDLWWQYIDQEARVDNISGVRQLMERVMTTRHNSTKQIKALLKKWLALEKRIGDDKGVQAVLERAREFVANTQKE